MTFNPDAYLAKQAGGFDPDAYLAKAGQASPDKAILDPGGPGQTALESFANNLTLGHLPHAQAAVSKALGLTDSYTDERDANIKRLAAQSAENPKSSLLGTVLGMGGSLLIPGGAVAKGAGLGAKLATGAKLGAAYGLVSNPGDVEGQIGGGGGDPLQLAARGKNAAIGAGVGAGAAGLAEMIGKLAGRASGYFGGKSEEKAFRALTNPTQKDFQTARGRGQVNTLGREALDSGLVGPLTTPGSAEAKLDAARTAAGEKIGGILDGAPGNAHVDAEALALELLDNPEIKQLAKTPGMEGVYGQVMKQIETLGNNKTLSLRDAQRLRQGIDKSINHAKRVPEMSGAQPYLNEQARGLSGKMNDAINAMGGEQDALKDANRAYSNLSTLSNLNEKGISRAGANRAISLTDTIAGAAGMASGGPMLSAGLAGANKLGRTFGNSVMATGFDAASKGLAKIPGAAALAQNKPRAFQALMGALTAKADGAGGFESAPAAEILNDPDTIELFRNTPAMLEQVKDGRLKAEIEKRIQRSPGTAMERRLDKSQQPPHNR